MQVYLVEAKGRNIRKSAFERGRMVVSGKQVCHAVTLLLVQGMLLRQLYVYGTSGEKRVVRRDEQVRPRNVTTARDDRHLVRMAVTDRIASSTVLSRRWGTGTGLDLSASTVRRRLLRAGLVACMPLRRLPLSRDNQRLILQ